MVQNFTYYRPETLQEALQTSGTYERPYFLAGGTDLLLLMKHKLIQPDAVIDLKHISELKRLELTDKGLHIGSAVTITEVVQLREIWDQFQPLGEGAVKLGSLQIRNRATVAGNVCNASPCANTVTPLAVLGAQVLLESLEGTRKIPVAQFITGVKRTDIRKGEAITGILIDKQPVDAAGGFYEKTRIKGPDISSASVSLLVSRQESRVRLCLGSVSPVPIVLEYGQLFADGSRSFASKLEQVLEEVRQAIKPITDVRSTKSYRSEIVPVYVKRLLERLWQEAEA